MYIIGNGIVIAPGLEKSVIKDGGVVIDGETITEVGLSSNLREKYPEAVFKDAGGRVIMPGLINTHTHLYGTFARGMDLKTNTPPKNFTEILEKLWWRLDYKLDEEDIYYSALYGIFDCIRNGTTTIFDHHASYGLIEGSLDIIARAVNETGIRASLAFEISDRHGPKKAEAAVRENERFLNKLKTIKKDLKQAGYLAGTVGLHASFTLEDETLERAVFLAEEMGVPCHIHLAEGIADVRDSRKRGYEGVAKRLDQFGVWLPASLAVHGVHLEREELGLLARRGVYLIHNPQSNMGNAVGACPLKQAFEAGLKAGLGTDGFSQDMFESLRAASLLLKHEHCDPRVGGEEVLKLLFKHNIEIAQTHFKRKMGLLKPGYPADLIIVDYHSPTPITDENYPYHILMGMAGSMVDTTIVGGKILMENREVKAGDYERIRARIQEQAGKFWGRF